MKKILLLTLLMVAASEVFAQQDALYHTYPFNPLALNPAYAGTSGVTTLSVISRRRSLALQNTPSSQFFSIDFPLTPKNKMSFGMQAFADNYSAANVGLYGSLAYHLPAGDIGTLSLGMQGGFTQIRATNFYAGVNEFKPNVGFGAYFRTQNAFVGVGMPTALRITSDASSTGGGVIRYEFYRPIFINAGYVFDVTDEVAVKASILVRYISKATTNATALDLNGTVWFRNKFGLGIWSQGTGSEYNSKAFLISAEFNLGEKFRLGYSYDFSAGSANIQGTNPLTGGITTASGLHQIMIRYGWDSGDGKMKEMRYF